MAKRKVKPVRMRPALDVLDAQDLPNCRLARIQGSNILFVVSAHVRKNKEACRYLEYVTQINGQNVISEGKLRPKFWYLNFFDPSDWHAKFAKMDAVIASMKKNTLAA